MITKTNFKGLTEDLTFKFFFSHKIILEDYLNSLLDFLYLPYRYSFSSITPQSFIMPNNQEIKCFYGDIVATLDNGMIISLEMIRHPFTKEDYNKSFDYMNQLFTNQMKVGNKKYREAKKVLSINLMNNNFRRINDKLINEYEFAQVATGKLVDEGNTKMYLVRLDLFKNIPYNKHRFIRWQRLLNASSIEELEQIAKGDEIMEQSIEFVKEWTKEHSGMEKYIAEKEAKAIAKGETKGSRKTLLKTAKNMLSLNIDIQKIMQATGLTKKQIEALK